MGNMSNILGGIGKALGGAAIPGTFANKAMMGPDGMGMGAVGMLGSMLGGPNPNEEELNPGQKMFGMTKEDLSPGTTPLGNIDPRMVIDESGAMGNGSGDEQIVSGDGWRPKKSTVLGDIMDALMMREGKQPYNRVHRDQMNVNQAMEGFDKDPMQAIRRLSRIQGHEDDAYKMYNTHRDNERADSVAELNNMLKQEKIETRIGSMLGAVRTAKDPAAAYDKMRPIIQNYADRYKLGDIGLPETYDEDAVNAWFSRGITPDQQVDNERDMTKFTVAEEGRNSRTAYSQGQQNYRSEMGQDRQDARNAFNQDRADHRKSIPSASGGSTPGAKARVRHPYAFRDIKDKSGNVIGIVNKEGTVAQMSAPDGGVQYFEVLPNGKLGKRITK